MSLLESKILSARERLSAQIGNTPMRKIYLLIDGRWRPVWLKLEGCNPAGSSKDRAAISLIGDLEDKGLIKSSSTIVESTSGNLGVALAYICRELGYGFLAVVDPKTTPENRRRMRNLGAELDLVEEQDETGGYLLSRLKRVKQLCSQSPNYVWTDQYSSPANPRSYYDSLAPEIYRQMDGAIDAIFVAVSTGGTLAGIGRYLRCASPDTEIIAVDACGSVIFGGSQKPRKLTGIGSSRESSFITSEFYDSHILVGDSEAFAACHQLNDSIAIKVGGSSGATLFACASYLAAHPDLHRVVCVCPDDGRNYDSTIFDTAWLAGNGFAGLKPGPLVQRIVIAE
jgi:N-(2-amino-2-carboxyethyl)-L-glutamate synthase